MRSIKKIFSRIRSENPYWSDYTCFAEAVRGRKFSRKTIIRNFNSLVDKEDYAGNKKKEVIDFLVELSKHG
jgi:predicted Ser/Thr protein kinase